MPGEHSTYGPRNRLRAINGVFEAAYAATDHLQYTEPTEPVTVLQKQKLQSFVGSAMAFRYRREVITTPRFNGLHVASPSAHVEPKLYDFELPQIAFTLLTLKGVDTKGNMIIADGLTVLKDDNNTNFVRVLRGPNDLTPTSLRYTDALLSEIRSDFDHALADNLGGFSQHNVQGMPLFER